MIPQGRTLRVVGDVHGDAVGFAAATATDRFVVQLGDLTDGGTDNAAVLRRMLDRRDAGDGLFLIGNHDHKLARLLIGHNVVPDEPLRATVEQLDDALRERLVRAVRQAPFWLRQGSRFFVHGAFHPAMLAAPAPPFGTKLRGALSFALFGQTTGRRQADGYPERLLDWIDRIPAGLTVCCGHDRRSTDGRPWVREGLDGGRAVFLDTGAGKGGHLSWIDLD